MVGKGIAALILASKRPAAADQAAEPSDAHEAGAEAVRAFADAIDSKDFAAAFLALHDAIECADSLPGDAEEESTED